MDWGGIIVIFIVAVMGMTVMGSGNELAVGARVDYYVEYYRKGEIVSGRPEYNYSISENHVNTIWFVFDVIIMTLVKIKFYWSIYFAAYSTTHKLICLVTILPVFILSLFSFVQIIKDRERKMYPFLGGVISYSFFQACTEVDFDMRYRAPVFLLLVICSGYGVKKIISWLTERKCIPFFRKKGGC